jgi:poly(A) polymerase
MMTGIASENLNPAEPLIIPEETHPIRLSMVDRDAVFVMRKLNQAGFSSYLVGGGVRDLYLGKSPKDFDISTDARPGQIRRLFPNSSTIGRRFRLVQVFFKAGKVIEVSTLRSLSEHDLDGPETVLAPNNTYGNLPEDAQRRDLSINSLFYELENNTIIDYVGGVRDLDNCIIRIIGDPDRRVTHDPVRMMRAIRHSARTGFAFAEDTWKAIRANHHKLILCPASRIRDELFKDLYGGSCAPWFDLAVSSGLFFAIFPFYRDILYRPISAQSSCLEQLKSIMAILDGISQRAEQGEGRILPKYFVLALLLLPWAEATLNLSRLKLKGPGLFQLSKKLRQEIDELLGRQMNLRRSTRQEMVTLLCNLPQFVRFVQNNSWPKWLKKKSYYRECLLFCQLQQTIASETESPKILEEIVDRNMPSDPPFSQKTEFTKKKSRPAFSPKKKGGIFGFRK